jgi:hypothetical protein
VEEEDEEDVCMDELRVQRDILLLLAIIAVESNVSSRAVSDESIPRIDSNRGTEQASPPHDTIHIRVAAIREVSFFVSSTSISARDE